MAGQSKASMRKKLRSAFAHKKLADSFIDQLYSTQTAWNSALVKLNADSAGALDVNYASTKGLKSTWDTDAILTGQSRQSAKKLMRSTLAHRKLADELCDALTEIQTAYTAILTKLDAEAGTLNDTNYASLLALAPLDVEDAALPAQHGASVRKSLRSALANKQVADYIVDSLLGLQTSMNSALDLLDAGTVTGVMAALKVSTTSPDAE
jgi:hypothetical protein